MAKSGVLSDDPKVANEALDKIANEFDPPLDLPAIGGEVPTDDSELPDESDISEPDETSDPSAVREFLAASMGEERKALTKLMRYLEKHGDTIKDLRSAYEGHQSRTARLYKLATRGLVNL